MTIEQTRNLENQQCTTSVRPTKLQCQQMVYASAGGTSGHDDSYTLRQVRNEGNADSAA